MPAYLPIEVQRNGSIDTLLSIESIEGDPLDLTGAAFTLAVRYAAGDAGDPLAQAAVEVDDPTAGLVSVLLLGSQFAAVPGSLEPVSLAYDLKAVQDGLPMILLRGPLVLMPGVS